MLRVHVGFQLCATSSFANFLRNVSIHSSRSPFSFPSKFFHVKEISIDATAIRPLLTFTSTSLFVIKFLIKDRGSPVCLISFFHFSRYPDFWKNYLILIYLIEFSLTDVTHKGRAIFMRFIIVEEKNWRNWVIIPTCIFRLWSGM